MTTGTQPLNDERPAKAPPKVRATHIRRVERARARQLKAEERLAEANAEVRQLIKDGFTLGISGEQLGKAADLSKPRAYQIRDDK